MRHLVPTAALLLTLTACATATSGVALPPPGQPASSAPGAQPSTVPTEQPNQAPKVDQPLNVDAFVKKIPKMCALLPKSLLAQHKTAGVTEPSKKADGVNCLYSSPKSGRQTSISIDDPSDPDSDGLAGVYLVIDTFYESYTELDVAGYPAVNVVLRGTTDTGLCTVIVGLNDKYTLRVGGAYYGNRTTACKAVEAFAEAAVTSLKRAQ